MFKPNDQVRNLTVIPVPGRATPFTPGYLLTVAHVDGDTVTVERDGHTAAVRAADLAPAYQVVNGISYDARTPADVVAVLERCRLNRTRVRVHYGHARDEDGNPAGKDWLEESHVTGRIGNSTGRVNIPLIVANNRSLGGPGLLDASIVKVRTTGKHGATLYQHPSYHTGRVTLRDVGTADTCGGRSLIDQGYTVAVDVDGRNHANFKTPAARKRWLDNMGLTAAAA